MAWAVVLATACLLAPSALGQNEVLNELYGSGVHAYNSGNFREAYDDLTMAIRSGSRDPRVYYYRGLAYLRLGRPQEARADFNKAAVLEMSDNDHFYPVSKSLERIQGSARLQIERARANARLVAYQTRERQWDLRYNRRRKNEPNVLAPADGEMKTLPAPKPKPTPPKTSETPEDEMPAETPDEAMPDEKPVEKSPSGDEDDAKKPAEEMPAETPEEKSPFGDDEDAKKPAEEMPDENPAEDSPFGDDADAKDPADEMPAETEDGDENANDMKDEGADEKADEKKDDGDGNKPAGEKKPDEENPFGT